MTTSMTGSGAVFTKLDYNFPLSHSISTQKSDIVDEKIRDVTCVMKTYANADFTRAAVWALRRYYPQLRIIFADGHPSVPFLELIHGQFQTSASETVWIPGACCEDCQNAAVALVKTPYVLLMDNDTKVIGPEAIPLCLEAFDKYPGCAASGWYGLVVTDWDKCEAFVGTTYTDHMFLDATQAAFSIHSVAAWRAVGGMPREPFYPSVPRELWDSPAGCAGDLTLCRRYKAAGYDVVSPRAPVPVLHWGQAVEWMSDSKGKSPLDAWWFTHVKHTRCNPLNEWRTYAAAGPLS